MTLLAFGINHTTAPLAIRERVAFAPDAMNAALQGARGQTGASEAAILSTCNRTEIYLESEQQAEQVLSWLVAHSDVSEAELVDCHYLLRGDDALRHMMKVAGGLDSLVLGEPQILGQMKSAYAMAREAGTVGASLHAAFQQVFAVAKQVRSQTGIGENPVSVAYTAVTLAQQIFSDLKQDTALLVGAGETIELVAQHLSEQGIQHIVVANRTLDRAQALAGRHRGEAILLSEIPEHLHRADIVISSTASQLPLLGKGAVESALKVRKHKPMFMLDIAVPRDIEAEVGDLADVYLYTVDDLQVVIDQNLKSRQEAADRALNIIEGGVENFRREQRALDAVDTIRAYRAKAEQLREQELLKALNQLQGGAEPEKVLNQLARNLTNKLLHAPTTALREASAKGEYDTLRLAHDLFAITQDDIERSENE
ncbi:glutamyl-tRNA reductase [Gilvimarinus sp. SDUM040013]|uniref:Glutamyl-tRNA reductase n=1 Tax=Gilvimarinus gilvus TaxID=3058038 RepID=A0ABU4RZU6_9GAMM|nr:glutamyl-tRNA reductase [Gilvimarinus sp. SDUM040013]MDO3386072.1 glutamyl-tRNA reductase [Gilvimarinus sp. SDUM040013]MDX6850387.1 glutamyl-tRNA reductase [Gilvimarinus sp. SDUM040013]